MRDIIQISGLSSILNGGNENGNEVLEWEWEGMGIEMSGKMGMRC